MTASDRGERGTTWALAVAAAAMTAQQVAGKATRDTLFLGHFPVAQWPVIMAWASLLSIAIAFASARLMSRWGPPRLMPAMFAASAALQVGIGVLATRRAGAAAVLFTLHMTAVVPVLFSGFWSTFNERFDPRSAKREISRLGAIGMLGGLAGGVLANVVAARAGVIAMLPLLASAHAVCALAMIGVARHAARHEIETEPDAGGRLLDGVRYLRSRPYLRSIAALVLVATISAGFLDYVFRAHAEAAFDGDALMRVFSWFHTSVALAAFLTQIAVSRISVHRLRLAWVLWTEPVALAVGSLMVLVSPRLVTAAIGRSLEMVLTQSLFRSGYELLFTPVAVREKRATKALVDVAVGRAGDALGSAATIAIVALAGARAQGVLLVLSVLLAAWAGAVVLRLLRGYVGALASRLKVEAPADAPALDLSMSQSLAIPVELLAGDVSQSIPIAWINEARQSQPATPTPARGAATPAEDRTDERLAAPAEPPRRQATREPGDPTRVIERMVALRSGDPERIRRALAVGEPLVPELVPLVVGLLGETTHAGEAVRALRRIAPRVVGQIVDALLDPEQPVEVRRRLPRVLSACPDPRAVEGLLRGLEDVRFQVRLQCGWALSRLREAAPELAIPSERLLAAVLREVAVEKHVWQGRRELSKLERDEGPPLVDDFVRERANSSLQHVFTLLSLAVPEPSLLRIAFDSLRSDDPKRRGTALEYLECMLPPEVRQELWPFLEEIGGRKGPIRTREEIIADLVSTNESMRISIAELRRIQEGPA